MLIFRSAKIKVEEINAACACMKRPDLPTACLGLFEIPRKKHQTKYERLQHDQ
jgi:hypothetical protein